MAASLPVSRVVVTNNHDIASLVRRIDRSLVETTKSASSNVPASMPYDVARLEAAIAMMKSFKAWVISQPPMDAPESAPVQISVECFGTVPTIENDSAWDLGQLLDTMIIEVANSVSSRISANMLPADAKRFDEYVDRIERLLVHIKGSEPVDYPESSPRNVNAGEGLTGIKFTKAA